MAASPNPYRLTLRGTYILPTGPGLLQALGWILLTAASLNFGLGVMLVFCLLLAAVALVCMVETVRNLAGVEVELQPPPPSPAGQPASFIAVLRPLDGRPRPGVRIALAGATPARGWRARLGLHLLRQAVPVDIAAEGTRIELALTGEDRGRLYPERLLVASTWPLGLFRAWRGWTPDVPALIHPEALEPALPRRQRDGRQTLEDPHQHDRSHAGLGDAHGDFSGHRRRQEGDPLRRVDWRASLRAGQLLVAQRETAASGAPLWLRWDDHAPASAEVRLARLTAEVLAAFRQDRRFGLELPGLRLPLDGGRTHRDRALALIAEFPGEELPPQTPRAQATSPAPAAELAPLSTPMLLRWTAIVLVAALPLAFQLHANAWLPWVLLMAARLWLLRSRAKPPGTLWLTLGAVVSAAWIHSRYHALLGREPGMALLLLMAGLKLLEARRERDLHTLTVLSLFLLLSAHFQTQAPWLGVWDLATCALLLDGLLAAQQDSAQPARRRTLLRMTLTGLPVAALLFVLLPRPDHPFWGFSEADEGTSGSLSDHMTPGSISRLRLSDKVAFRARFSGAWPGNSNLYWRGPVLEQFDGKTWSVAAAAQRRSASGRRGRLAYEYTYQAESPGGAWVFALEWPDTAGTDLHVDAQAVTRVTDANARTRLFQLRAWPDARLDPTLDPEMLAPDLAVPANNPLTRALAEPWRRLAPAQRIQAAQQAFVAARLQYNLEVPAVGPDPIDDLMFGSHTGYCEHFASAFAFMLRVAGVPARVVTGYQGGERNPLGDYLIVRQSDAHAWVEAWLPGEGWLRIDPTALTVPALLQGGSQAAAPLPVPTWMPGFVRASLPAWHRLQLLRDLAAMQWQQNVANLNASRQRALFEQLGLGEISPPRLIATCALLVSGALGVQLLLAMRKAERQSDGRTRSAGTRGEPASATAERRVRQRWQRQWRRGERLLRLAGSPRGAQEGPQAYLDRLARERPTLRNALVAWSKPCLVGIYAPQRQHPGLPGVGEAARALLELGLALVRSRRYSSPSTPDAALSPR